jgi:hypothetical protein
MTSTVFLVRFPEFVGTPINVVKAALVAAALSVAADVWGDLTAEGIGYLAAHKIASGPGGFGVRTETKGTGYQRTLYGAHYEDLARSVSARASRVVGGTTDPYATVRG